MNHKLQGRRLTYLLLVILLLFSLVLLVWSFLGGVADQDPASSPAVSTSGQQTTEGRDSAPTQTPPITPSPLPALTVTSTPTPIVVLPAEAVQISFQAGDGQALEGIYYPGSANPAPVIVLMPWARGDQTDWEPAAAWLQGRGMLTRQPDYNDTWTSSDWYPERSQEFPLGVFTFDFRNCQGGCQAYQPAEWLEDAQAAVQTASQLPGADPDRILTAGASIGADAALDACTWFNQMDLGTCLGSFAISPGSFLTESFPDQAARLIAQVPDAQIYCLYGLRDDASVETCEGSSYLVAFNFGYVDKHGMELLQAGQRPDPLALLEEFILDAAGEVR